MLSLGLHAACRREHRRSSHTFSLQTLEWKQHAFSGLFCQAGIQHNVSAKAAQRVNQLAVTDIVNISVTHSVAALDYFFFLPSHVVFIFAWQRVDVKCIVKPSLFQQRGQTCFEVPYPNATIADLLCFCESYQTQQDLRCVCGFFFFCCIFAPIMSLFWISLFVFVFWNFKTWSRFPGDSSSV